MVATKNQKNTNPSAPESKVISPTWRVWKRTTATMMEGILLSLNVCPSAYMPGNGINKLIDECYWERLQITMDALPFGGWVLDKGGSFPYSSGLVIVDLKKFVSWVCDEAEWENLPSEFVALQPKIKFGAPPLNEVYKDSRASKEWSEEELEALLRKSEAGKSNADLARAYDLDRSRISQLLKKARSLTGPCLNDPFSRNKAKKW